jgi:hypothetical protein
MNLPLAQNLKQRNTSILTAEVQYFGYDAVHMVGEYQCFGGTLKSTLP